MTDHQNPTAPATGTPSAVDDIARLAADEATRGRARFNDLDALGTYLDSPGRSPVERVIGVHQ